MFEKNATIFVILFLTISNSFAAAGAITGKVIKMRTHQYLSGSGWDRQTRFCLDDGQVVGSCATSANCSGKMGIVISDEAHPNVFSQVLAA